jgi:hypothetical protein
VADPSGIDLMRRRIERAARRPPPAPRARAAEARAPAAPSAAPASEASAPRPDPPAGASPAGRRPARPSAPARPRLAPDLPPVNLAIRVRKPLDDQLADLIHELRRDGVRTSKVELIEMLLWEQSGTSARAVRERLGAFRDAAPRGAGAPLSER